MGLGRWEWLPSMPETQATAKTADAPSDLISFLKARANHKTRPALLRLEFADWIQCPAQNHQAALVDREQLALGA
jgi:hypothetical protein